MEKLTKSRGIHSGVLRTWGLLLTAAGIAGTAIVQRGILKVDQISGKELLAAMQASDSTMVLVTLALVLRALESCAVPIFALLLVEGFQHTSGFLKYFLRILGTAALSEIPFNIAVCGRFFSVEAQNPVLGIALGLVVLFFYDRYSEKSAQNVLIKLIVTISALLWAGMLRIEYGAAIIILVAVLWLCRKNPLCRNLGGMAASASCSLLSPYFLASPMAFIIIHFYRGEKGPNNRLVNYLAYPVIVLIAGIAAICLK